MTQSAMSQVRERADTKRMPQRTSVMGGMRTQLPSLIAAQVRAMQPQDAVLLTTRPTEHVHNSEQVTMRHTHARHIVFFRGCAPNSGQRQRSTMRAAEVEPENAQAGTSQPNKPSATPRGKASSRKALGNITNTATKQPQPQPSSTQKPPSSLPPKTPTSDPPPVEQPAGKVLDDQLLDEDAREEDLAKESARNMLSNIDNLPEPEDELEPLQFADVPDDEDAERVQSHIFSSQIDAELDIPQACNVGPVHLPPLPPEDDECDRAPVSMQSGSNTNGRFH